MLSSSGSIPRVSGQAPARSATTGTISLSTGTLSTSSVESATTLGGLTRGACDRGLVLFGASLIRVVLSFGVGLDSFIRFETHKRHPLGLDAPILCRFLPGPRIERKPRLSRRILRPLRTQLRHGKEIRAIWDISAARIRAGRSLCGPRQQGLGDSKNYQPNNLGKAARICKLAEKELYALYLGREDFLDEICPRGSPIHSKWFNRAISSNPLRSNDYL